MMEEVTVTGVRRSLLESATLKRDSDGVVDAIVAEDIGKFPDTNLAESLQRITGVSIDRGSSRGAEGEGQRITVRGIGPDFNLVLLNGRQMPTSSLQATTTNNSRAFDFSNLASESVTAVEVFKTSMATIPTGGIGATVNIRTARPLDIGDLSGSVGVKGVWDDSAADSSLTPEVSGIFSNVFADGKFGIALSAIYQERDYGYNQAGTTSGWIPQNYLDPGWQALPAQGAPGSENYENLPGPDDLYSLPQNITYLSTQGNRERLNGQLVVQFAPTDSLEFTLDYTYSELTIQERRNDLGAWFIQCGTCGGSTGSFTDGPIVTPLVWSEDWSGRDVGSGGGIDVLLSAKRVGDTGYAYGLDMTDEMLRLARKNAAEADATNVEFMKGTIEEVPLRDASVDVVISNCVVNLAADKPAVFREIARDVPLYAGLDYGQVAHGGAGRAGDDGDAPGSAG